MTTRKTLACLLLLAAFGAEAHADVTSHPCMMALAQGSLEERRAQFQQALVLFEQARKEPLCEVEAQIGLARTLNSMNEHKDALAAGEWVVDHSDDSDLLAEAYYEIGRALHKPGKRMTEDKTAAEEAYRKAVEQSEGRHRGAIRALMRLYQETRQEDRLAEIQEQHPDIRASTRAQQIRTVRAKKKPAPAAGESAAAAGKEPAPAAPDAREEDGPPVPAPALAEEDSTIVATWSGGSIERADYDSWRAFHEIDDNADAIREMVFVESFAASSRERGGEQQLRTRLELEAMRHQVLVSALHDHTDAEVVVSEEEIEALRRGHPEAFRRPRKLELRNIYKQLEGESTRARMHEIRRQLVEEGADFRALARSESESQTRFLEGRLGVLAPEELPPEAAAAVRDLKAGGISEVVEHGGGLSIFLCEEVREAVVPTADEVRAKLRNNLTRIRRRERWESLQESLLAEAAPRFAPASDTTVLEMDGYRLSAQALAELVARRGSGEPPDPAAPEIEKLLRDWALGVLAARRAVELGLDRDPQTAAALRWGHLDILARRELVRRVDERLREPSEEELRRWFQANSERYQHPEAFDLAVIHFAAAAASDRQEIAAATDVARRLAAGELPFEDAARRHSIHPSAAAGGLIGWRDLRQVAVWGPTVTKAVRQISPGENTGLLRTESGLWIFELRGRRDACPMTFEDAEGSVREALRRRQVRELEVTVREEQLSRLGVTIPSDSAG